MPLGPIASNELRDAIYDRLVTLVSRASVDAGVREYAADGGAFVLTSWGERIGEEDVAAHHGSSVAQAAAGGGEEKLKEWPGAGAGANGSPEF